jgi:hypothetical protein
MPSLLKPNQNDFKPQNEDFFSAGDSLPVSGEESELAAFIKAMPPNSCAPFTTQGRVTSAKLLKEVLEKTGKADVYITSWSITQGAVQQLVNMLNAGGIGNITIVLDSRAPKHWPEAFQMLSANVARLRLAKCHAKLIAVVNDKHAVLISSSLNWSEKHSRFEAGCVITHRAHVDKMIADIETLYSKANTWN